MTGRDWNRCPSIAQNGSTAHLVATSGLIRIAGFRLFRLILFGRVDHRCSTKSCRSPYRPPRFPVTSPGLQDLVQQHGCLSAAVHLGGHAGRGPRTELILDRGPQLVVPTFPRGDDSDRPPSRAAACASASALRRQLTNTVAPVADASAQSVAPFGDGNPSSTSGCAATTGSGTTRPGCGAARAPHLRGSRRPASAAAAPGPPVVVATSTAVENDSTSTTTGTGGVHQGSQAGQRPVEVHVGVCAGHSG